MTALNLKSKIQRDQFTWFLTLLLNERDIFRLLMETNIFADPDRLYSTSKQELLSRLTNALFRHSKIDVIVAEHLSKMSETAITRIGYMVVEEIYTYFKSPGPLIESGEFGEVVWALLMDPREDVHSHGYHLLTTAYETQKPSNNIPPLQYYLSYNSGLQPNISEINAVSTKLAGDMDGINHQFSAKTDEIDRLERSLADLRAQHTSIEKNNILLQEHCQLLIEENEVLKTKEGTYREKEKQVVFLQQENHELHQRVSRYSETAESLNQLESENKKLRTENQDISDQFSSLSHIKSANEVFSGELKIVEEAIYKEYNAIEQIKSDIQHHFDVLEKTSGTSRKAINQIKNTIDLYESPQLDVFEHDDSQQPRVGVFVDVQNMFYAAKDRFERRVDYIKLLDLIVGPRQLISAYAYIVQIPEIKQGNFISLLEHNGYTIRSKDLRLRGDGSAKGDWDVGIAVDVVSMLGTLDVVILASGDGDFCPLAELIKQQHKRIEVVAFEHNTSMDLQAMADQFFAIGEELLM